MEGGNLTRSYPQQQTPPQASEQGCSRRKEGRERRRKGGMERKRGREREELFIPCLDWYTVNMLIITVKYHTEATNMFTYQVNKQETKTSRQF